MKKQDFVQTMYELDNAMDSIVTILEDSEIGQILKMNVADTYASLNKLRQKTIREFLKSVNQDFYNMIDADDLYVNCSIFSQVIRFTTKSETETIEYVIYF